jgi:hypothetical protein
MYTPLEYAYLLLGKSTDCENEVLRRIFGSMREEVKGGWRKLHSEELHHM